jgi:hypothetical protein
MQTLLSHLDAISQLLDDGAWEAAQDALRVYDRQLRTTFAIPPTADAPHVRELLNRQRHLSLKLGAMHSDAAQSLDALRRDRAAAERYLAA